MAAQFVKPYVKTNKNDVADAEAICEAVARPNMRFVPIKNIEQQAVLALHRARQGFVSALTAQGHWTSAGRKRPVGSGHSRPTLSGPPLFSRADVHCELECRTRLLVERHEQGTFASIGCERPASDVWASSIPPARRELLQRQRR
jgi:transposase